MTTKQTFIRVLKWTGGVLSFLLILVLLTTWLINRGPFQGRVRQAVSEHAGDTLTFGQLRIALLPRPHIVLNNAIIYVPGAVSGLVPTAVIYPELLQLLKGKVRIAAVSMKDPDIDFTLSDKPGAEEEDPAAVFTETRSEIEAVMNRVRKAAPEFEGEVQRGKLRILRDGKKIWEMSRINAEVSLEPRGFNIRMDADAPRWGRISAEGEILVLKHGFRLSRVSVSGGRSSLSGLSARFSWRRRPFLQITTGQAAIALEDVYDRRASFLSLKDRLRGVKTMKGIVRFTELSFRGPLFRRERWKLQTAGRLEAILFSSSSLPRPVRIESGSFFATATSLALNLRGAFLDSSLTASAIIGGSPVSVQSLDVTVNGVVRSETLRWTDRTFGPSPWLALHTPLTLADFRIGWKKGGLLSLSGRAANKNGAAVSIDLDRTPRELRINRMTIEDGKIGATLAVKSSENILDVKFKGSLNEKTLMRIFERPPGQYGWIRGDAQARLRFDRPQESTAAGKLEGADLILPFRPPVFIRHMNLQANSRVLTVNSGLFDWADMRVNMKGAVTASDEGFTLDLDAGTESVNVDKLRQVLASEKKEKGPEHKKILDRIPLRGVIRVYAADFIYEGYNLKPFRADALFMPDTIRLKLITATLCGVSLGGTVQPFGEEVQFDLVPIAVPQQLEPVLQCFNLKTRMTGEFNMYSFLRAKGPAGKLKRSLYGHFEFFARDGKMYRYPLLSRILAFLNVTELLRGKLPDPGREGFAYKSIRIKGDILNGKLILKEASLEGATLNLAAEGEIDLAANTINVTVLVAPFKTIEYILNKIPVIRNILANRLITVPVQVRGDLNNPQVTALAPEAIGRNLLDIMKRIIAIPFKILGLGK